MSCNQRPVTKDGRAAALTNDGCRAARTARSAKDGGGAAKAERSANDGCEAARTAQSANDGCGAAKAERSASILHLLSCLLLLFLPLLSLSQTTLPFQQNAITAENEDQMAQQFFQAKNFEKAGEIYARIYEKRPGYYTYTYYFFCLVELREYDEARKLIRIQQKSEPNSLKYLVDLGYVMYREGNTDKSRKQYDEAVKRLPPDPAQVYELANAFYAKGEFDYVIRTYKKGRQMLPENYAFGFEMAGVYERMGNFESAFEEYLYMLALNKSFEPSVRDRLQALLALDDDNSRNEAFRKLVLSKVQKDPDKTCYSELLLWYSVQQKDFQLALMQAKALDRRMKENGERVMELASLAISNGDYQVAEEAFRYVIGKGPSCDFYEVAQREMLNTQYQRMLMAPGATRKQMEELRKELETGLIAWEGDPDAVDIAVDLAHLDAFYLGRPDAALDLLDRVLDWRGLKGKELAAAKLELADIHVFNGNMWTATVLYEQVYRDFKNDAVGQEAKFRNARLSYYMGEFDWARAQLDILSAATSKFIANDAMKLAMLIRDNVDPDSSTVALGMYSRAELADFRNQDEVALRTLDSVPAMFREHPILDQVSFRKGEIYLKTGNYAMADSMFALVIRNRPMDIITDEAIMNRALIHEQWMADKQGAMDFYQVLLNEHPGSMFIPEARKRFRTLRGDARN